MTIQQSIRNHRYDAKVTQNELARRTGIAVRNIVFWESGRGNPSFNDCLRIARGLEITIQQLIDGVMLPEGHEQE